MRHSWTISKERNRLEEQVSAGKLDPSKQFDFSEIYIFGKYENFVKRVSNINELLNTIQNFRAGLKCFMLIGPFRWTNERTVFSTNEKARWKNATLRELKQPIQTLTQLLNLSRENHMTFLIIARYMIHMTSNTSLLQFMSHRFEILILGDGHQIAPKIEVIFENRMTSKGRIIFRRRDMTTIWHSDNFVTTFWQTPLRYDYRIFHFWTNKNFLWF